MGGCLVAENLPTVYWQQDHQALHKAKYCSWVAPVASAGSNKMPKVRVMCVSLNIAA